MIRWDSKILLCKLETTYATDSGPTGAANAILATNVVLSPMEGQDVSRDLDLAYLAAQATIPAGLYTRLTFRVELVASGTAGVAAAWGPVLRVMGVSQTIVADTSVTYRPVSDGHESATLHVWIGPTRYVMRGCRGTAVLRLDAQGVAYLECTVQGLFSRPTDQTRPTPDFSAFKRPKVVSHANTPVFTVDEVPMVMRNYSFDLGNVLQNRFLVGSEGVYISNKTGELVSFQIEATALSIYDPFAAAEEEDDLIEIEIQHESAAGRKITITHPTTQAQRPSILEGDGAKEWSLRHTPLPTVGNDQWSITIT